MRCTSFRPFERATLRGFATIQHDNGLVVLDCLLHEQNGKRWCNPPSRPMLDKERQLVTGDDGKIKYAPLIEFVDAKTRSAWSAAAVRAIDAFLDGKAPAAAGAMNGGSHGCGLTREGRDG